MHAECTCVHEVEIRNAEMGNGDATIEHVSLAKELIACMPLNIRNGRQGRLALAVCMRSLVPRPHLWGVISAKMMFYNLCAIE